METIARTPIVVGIRTTLKKLPSCPVSRAMLYQFSQIVSNVIGKSLQG